MYLNGAHQDLMVSFSLLNYELYEGTATGQIIAGATLRHVLSTYLLITLLGPEATWMNSGFLNKYLEGKCTSTRTA